MVDPLKASSEQAERLHRFAHDIRNRLSGMNQIVHMLAAPEPGTDPAELSLFGEQQFFKAMRATEILLDDLGVDRSVDLSVRVPVDLAQVVREAYANVGYRFERKEQETVMEPAEHIVVQGDAKLLTDLVAALLTNAAKFTPKGGHITVRLRARDGQALLEVRDDGVGLSPADLDRIFVRYAWLDSRSTDGEPQGRSTLSRAAQWATAHGGGLTVTSEGPGQGSSFTLLLPLAD